MTEQLKDVVTLSVPADFLDSLIPEQFIKTPKRLLPGSKNLYWWMRCYPNGYPDDFKGHVSVFVYTNIGGFEKSTTVTIVRSGIKCTDTKFYSEPAKDGWESIASHGAIKSGDIIKNGVFVIKCEVVFKIPNDLKEVPKIEAFEDSCIVKFDRKTIETHSSGQKIVEKKRKVDGITWWIEYFPCGRTENEKNYVSVYFHIDGGPVTAERSCGMSIGGTLVQKLSSRDYGQTDAWGFAQSFSHKQCQLADNENGIIDLVCNVRFVKPDEIEPMPTDHNSSKLSINDSIMCTIQECQLDYTDVGEFDATSKQAVGAMHQWRLQCFPAGDCTIAKRHISVFIQASTTETKTVTLSGMIRIVGTSFQKPFKMIVENDSSCAFQKLISHEELRRIGGIVDDKVKIVCEGTFHTFNDVQLD